MKKTKYDELKASIALKVKEAGSSRFSKSDFTSMTHTLLNTPEQEVEEYIKDIESPVMKKPVERYRESLKPVIKQFGVDDAELDKIQTITFSKEHAEAFNDLATQVVKDYTATGRKLVLPITDKKDAQMEISQISIDEKVEDTKKFEEQPDGTYKQVPTGKRKTTYAHNEMKISNKKPAWLVKVEDI